MRPEEKIESDFVYNAAKEGFWAIKFEDRARKGAPDRLVLLPEGKAIFIEFKVPGKEARPEQLDYIRQLRRFGFMAGVYSSAEQALKEVREFHEADIA